MMLLVEIIQLEYLAPVQTLVTLRQFYVLIPQLQNVDIGGICQWLLVGPLRKEH